MAAFGVIVHPERSRAGELARDAAKWLADRGHEVRLPMKDAGICQLPDLGVPEVTFARGLDVIVSLGGDGTMLRAVDLGAPEGVPVIGVNVGQLGYLTQVEPEGLHMALKRFLNVSYDVEERMMLEVRVDAAGSDPSVRSLALNEAVLEKTPGGHTVRLGVTVDGDPFTPYQADGMIVATPTGSTAYALSARGPIVAPTHRCLLLTPVSPHMLFDRTLVLAPDAELRIEVLGPRPANLSVDGRPLATLEEHEAIVCTAARQGARLVMFGRRDFLGILKSKFGLSDR